MKKFLNIFMLVSALSFCGLVVNSCGHSSDSNGTLYDGLSSYVQGYWEEQIGSAGETFYMLSFDAYGSGTFLKCLSKDATHYTLTESVTFTYTVDEKTGYINTVNYYGTKTAWAVKSASNGYLEMSSNQGTSLTLKLYKNWTYTKYNE
jgi:hypothetical protein